MKKTFFLIPILLFVFSCENNANDLITEETNENIQDNTLIEEKEIYKTPENFINIEEVSGDLDDDGENELVIVYNTDIEGDIGFEREIHILKKHGKGWTLWYKANGPIMPTESGGMMGDPFEELTIENGLLKIYHSGGSSERWSYLHHYQFKNDNFCLIYAESINGKPCIEYVIFEYNLISGDILSYGEIDDCDGDNTRKINERKLIHVLDNIEMNEFYPGEYKLEIDKKTIFYF